MAGRAVTAARRSRAVAVAVAAAAAIGATAAAGATSKTPSHVSAAPSHVSHAHARAALDIPPSWRPLPSLSTRVSQRKHVVMSMEGWGDPSQGCFAVLERARATAPGVAPTLVDHWLRAGLAAGRVAVKDHRVRRAGDRAVSTFALARGALKGRAETITEVGASGALGAVAAACFYNERRPETCRRACDHMLAAFDKRGGPR